jgi:hypothetical protein
MVSRPSPRGSVSALAALARRRPVERPCALRSTERQVLECLREALADRDTDAILDGLRRVPREMVREMASGDELWALYLFCLSHLSARAAEGHRAAAAALRTAVQAVPELRFLLAH